MSKRRNVETSKTEPRGAGDETDPDRPGGSPHYARSLPTNLEREPAPFPSAPPTRTTVFSRVTPVDFAVADLNLDDLRRSFAELFDQAAHAIQLAGYEQDDGIINRWLVCRVGERELKVPADTLADADRFRRALLAEVEAQLCVAVDRDEVAIIGLRVDAILECWE